MFFSEQHVGLRTGVSAIALSAIAFAAAGCAAGGNISPTATAPLPVPTVTAPTAKPGHITGLVHGGQQPISGATIQMWVAGTNAGYGAGALPIGSTFTTDANGNFDLDTAQGNAPCANGQLVYITATGGSSQGASGAVNTVAALMLALPSPCATVATGGLSVVINEVTTVASVWALQQFMSITPANGPYTGGAVPWQIGSDSTNVTGLTNAFAEVAQLVNIATGLSGNSTLTSTVTGNAYVPTLTFTTTIVPDSNRIYIVADILAACINTADSSPNGLGPYPSLTCDLLFTDVSPNGGTFSFVPTDTIQAAYAIATAPGGITEYNIAGPNNTSIPAGTPLNTPGGVACSSVGCEWALQLCNYFVTATPPFPAQACTQGSSTEPSYPTDYAIGVKWSAVDNNGLTYGAEMGAIAIDGNGNIWTGNTGPSPGTGYPLVEWSPQGFVMQAVGGTFTMPSSLNGAVTVTSTSGVPGGSYNFSFGSSPPTVTLAPGSSPFTAHGITIFQNNLWAADYGAGIVGGQPLTSNGQKFYPGLVLAVPGEGGGFINLGVTATSSAQTPTPVISGAYPGPIAAGSNEYAQTNLWVGSDPQTGTGSGMSLNYMSGLAANGPIYEGQYVSGGFDQIVLDGLSGWAWGLPAAGTLGGTIYRNSPLGAIGSVGATTSADLASANISGANYTSGSGALVPAWGAIDQLNNLWVGEGQASVGTGHLAYLPTGYSDTPPPPSPAVYIGSTNSAAGVANDCTGGLQSPVSMAVDGLGNVFVANGVGDLLLGGDLVLPGGGISEFTGSGIPLSPTNYPAPTTETSSCTGAGMQAYGFNQDNTGTAAAANLSIDSSGNLWPGTAQGTQAVVHMVGLAAPVNTPLAAAVSPNYSYPTAWSSSGSGCSPASGGGSGNAYTITFTVPNNFKAPQSISAGQYVLLGEFASSAGTFLDSLKGPVEVLTATSTQFTACIAGGKQNASGGTEGVVISSRLGNRP